MSKQRPVQFTRQSAERIAAVVRQVELAAPGGGASLAFDRAPTDQFKVVATAKFTGSWEVGKSHRKTCTFTMPDGNTATASVVNMVAPYYVNGDDTEEKQCVIGRKQGTSWFFISSMPQSEVRSGFVSGEWPQNSWNAVHLHNPGVGEDNPVFAFNRIGAITSTAVTEVVVGREGKKWFLASGGGKGISVETGTFAGSWTAGSSKTVSLSGGRTATVRNDVNSASKSGTVVVALTDAENGIAIELPQEGAEIKKGTFDGTWPVGASKDVTVSDGVETSSVSVLNFVNKVASTATAQKVVFAKAGSDYVAVEVPLKNASCSDGMDAQEISSSVVTETQSSGYVAYAENLSSGQCVKWIPVQKLDVVTDVYWSGVSLVVAKSSVLVVGIAKQGTAQYRTPPTASCNNSC